ncbi:MFS transporter [Streptomyces sp. NPDC058464]|uniref:MFS transporter n=1 Tax=Streptomyces sp. NPDC058464 TaxID=3346511 RepID=UPI0036589D96
MTDAEHAPGTEPKEHPVTPDAMTRPGIVPALSGLLLGYFVAVLSSTIVSTALPTILADLGGGQSAYTWIVTAALLAMTATTPLWGKLSDLFSKRLLVQLALVLYVVGNTAAGLAPSAAWLIACRAVMGIGAGGLSALAQVIIAALVPARDRGRYSGYLGATYAVGTVCGPLVGGLITQAGWLGWRWCFFLVVPLALTSMALLQKTLRLPVEKRRVRVDWLGATLITSAVCLLMVWVTLAGDSYPWLSWQTGIMLGGVILLGLLFLAVESRASEPVLPLRLFRIRTVTLTAFAGAFVGVALFSGTVFISQYFQLARGRTPVAAGLMMLPLVTGLFLASVGSGRLISSTGRWRGLLVAGGLCLTCGLALLGRVRWQTPYWQIAGYEALVGIGIGLMMQNRVLVVQNRVAPPDLGSASSTVTFLRSLGGAVGVAALGAVLGARLARYEHDGLKAIGDPMSSVASGDRLSAPVRDVVRNSYGHAIADVFGYAAGCALVALVLVLFVGRARPRTAVAAHHTAAPSDQELRPTDEDALAGLVRAADSGVPVAGALVLLLDEDGRLVDAQRTNARGGFTFPAPPPGIRTVAVNAERLRPALLPAPGATALPVEVLLRAGGRTSAPEED